MEEEAKGKGVSRRDFLKGLGGGAIGTAVISTGLLQPDEVEAYPKESVGPRRGRSVVNLKINGRSYRLEVEHRQTLAEVLRDQLGFTGTKIGCNRGECGACTVVINGRNVYSCSQLAVWMEGKEILTIEGLAKGEKLDPVQEAFIEHDGPQCGFCTPGQIMSGKALLLRNSSPTEAQVRKALSGNLCRCGNYNREVAAVLAAAAKGR
ncbi:MAG: 2Fe-2S iron-sulfur cluster binding domain-containing protein [Deltaproteobacteria bacterium]|jgi:xanthine dehydrogenase YagT iron-sulfur-binding subunit|nr:2Fe-2S iron-sulfur cluster binding domain-containing protein [Deltaproteobacteria bacterium]